MFFDLNIPISPFLPPATLVASRKGKERQTQALPVVFSPGQIASIESRIDLLVQLGYTVVAFNQTLHKKVDPKIHTNPFEVLFPLLKRRDGIVYLKRLTIILDEDSEKGFGLINAHTSFFNSYDLLSLVPTTAATFSLACLTHSQPSPFTCHIISPPLTLPRLPYHFKHTMIRTAIRNGAVFEIGYSGAIGGDSESILVDAVAAESGSSAKRNWWAQARELVRVTKGKNLIISGGVVTTADLRAPRDVANLIHVLGLPQDASHAALTKVPKSLVLRAETRQTYRAILSEPRIVIPDGHSVDIPPPASSSTPLPGNLASNTAAPRPTQAPKQNKRSCPDDEQTPSVKTSQAEVQDGSGSGGKKKKRKKNKQGGPSNAGS